MAAAQESLDLLRSIDASLKHLVRLMAATMVVAPSVASDSELDSQYGDPKVNFNPRGWKGQSFKGRRYSQCPPEFLDALAEALDYFAGKADEKNEVTDKGKPVGDFKRKDAARARGWAARARKGTGAASPSAQAAGEPGRRAVPAAWAGDVDPDANAGADDTVDDDPFASDTEEVSAADIPWGPRS